MDELICAVNIRKSFGKVQAVRDVNLHIQAGEIYGLVGADGAGKTTTLRLLCGALRADQGEISIAGYAIDRSPEDARAQIGYLSQRFSLYEELTVLENIRFFAEVRGLNQTEWYPRSMEILDFVGLSEYTDRFAGKLSGGMKQKLGLATALVAQPQVFILDEPTTGVDPVTRQDFWQLIIKLVDPRNTNQSGRGVAVIVSTPYMDEAVRCHRIGFMRKGQIIAEGAPSQLRDTLKDRIIEIRGEPLPGLREILIHHPAVADAHSFGDRLHVRLMDAASKETINSLQSALREGNVKVSGIRAVPPILEDVFISLSRQES